MARGRGCRRADPGEGDLVGRRPGPGAGPGQRLVQDEAEPVDVRGRRRGRAARLLRAEVMDGPERRAGQGRLRVGRQPRDPEVGDHRPAVGGEQDVARLDVAMDDAAHVGDAKSARATSSPMRAACHGASRPLRRSRRGEVLAFDERHHEEGLVAVGAGVRGRRRCSGGGGRWRRAPRVGIGGRGRGSAATSGRRILTATSRSKRTSVARWIVAIPPRPMTGPSR